MRQRLPAPGSSATLTVHHRRPEGAGRSVRRAYQGPAGSTPHFGQFAGRADVRVPALSGGAMPGRRSSKEKKRRRSRSCCPEGASGPGGSERKRRSTESSHGAAEVAREGGAGGWRFCPLLCLLRLAATGSDPRVRPEARLASCRARPLGRRGERGLVVAAGGLGEQAAVFSTAATQAPPEPVSVWLHSGGNAAGRRGRERGAAGRCRGSRASPSAHRSVLLGCQTRGAQAQRWLQLCLCIQGCELFLGRVLEQKPVWHTLLSESKRISSLFCFVLFFLNWAGLPQIDGRYIF